MAREYKGPERRAEGQSVFGRRQVPANVQEGVFPLATAPVVQRLYAEGLTVFGVEHTPQGVQFTVHDWNSRDRGNLVNRVNRVLKGPKVKGGALVPYEIKSVTQEPSADERTGHFVTFTAHLQMPAPVIRKAKPGEERRKPNLATGRRFPFFSGTFAEWLGEPIVHRLHADGLTIQGIVGKPSSTQFIVNGDHALPALTKGKLLERVKKSLDASRGTPGLPLFTTFEFEQKPALDVRTGRVVFSGFRSPIGSI